MSVSLTTTYKRMIVLTFGAGAAALLLFLIYRNATNPDYDMTAFTFTILAQIILGTLAIDVFALQNSPGTGLADGEQ